MRRRYRKNAGILLSALLLTVMMAVTACGGSAKSASTSAPRDNGFMSADMRQTNAEAPRKDETPIAKDRKLVRTTDLDIETQSYEDLDKVIREKVEAFGGYIESSFVQGRKEEHSRVGDYVVRVPNQKLDAFLTEVGSQYNVISRNMRVDDITLQYSDTENRIKSLRAEQETLLNMLKKADKIEDIIAIQARLSDLRSELEDYESRKLLMDNRVDYSIVNIHFKEVMNYTEAEHFSYLEEAQRRLRLGWQGFTVNVRYFTLDILGALPYIVIILLVIAVLIWLGARSKRRYRKRKAEEAVIRQQMPYAPYPPQQPQPQQPPQPQGVTPPQGPAPHESGPQVREPQLDPRAPQVRPPHEPGNRRK